MTDTSAFRRSGMCRAGTLPATMRGTKSLSKEKNPCFSSGCWGGRPSARDGCCPVRSPRGRKAWALLCYLLLAERPPSRRRLAEILFGDADDPLGALRWALAELRRAFGGAVVLSGDPVVTMLGDDVAVDVDLLARRSGRARLAAGRRR